MPAEIDPHGLIASMLEEVRGLRRTLYHTPKWRVIKRYRLHEKILKLEEDADLIGHVMIDS